MACCGGAGTPAPSNPGEAKPGDVLAETLWAGMHTEYEPDSGRLYRGGNGSTVYIAPADAAKRPDLYRVVQDFRSLAPTRDKLITSGLI